MSDASPRIGQRVHISGKNLKGRVAYVGPTNFAPGKWVGVVLDEPKGKNNGTVRGSSYFKCAPNFGIFVRSTQLVIMAEHRAKAKVMLAAAAELPETTSSSDAKASAEQKKIAAVPLMEEPEETTTTLATNKNVTKQEKQQEDEKTTMPVAAQRPIEQSATEATSTKPPPVATSTTGATLKMLPPPTTNTRTTRSTSSTQLRPTRISQPKVTNSQQLVLAVPFELAPKRSKTSVSPTASFCCAKRSSFVETGFLEILRPQFTPGHPLRTPVAATPPAVPTAESSELQQLREELELVRAQRAEDKRKLHDLEKLRIQNEHMVEFKTRIMSQHGLLQRELQRSRQELRAAHDVAAKCKRELDELADSIELLTLDKEMAEERAETLQMELELAQEHNDELSLDIEIMRAESEGKLLATAPHGGDDVKGNLTRHETLQTTGELIRLEQYNQRLRDTVIRLRDTLAHDKQELLRANKELETKYSEISELKKIKETLTQRVDGMELQIIDLNEQVDAALGAESMVTTLAEHKLDLEERMKLLEEEVKELEALEEIHEQLLESNQDLEADLRDEIEKLCARVKLLEKEKDAAVESVYDREVTISKFRELVRNLNEQLQLKDAAFSIEDFSSTNSETQSNDFQHVFSSTKAYSRAIEQQLKTVELRLQRKHIDYLVAFVPEDFMLRGGEHDVLLVLLLLQRIGEKLVIICGAVNEKFPTACEFGRDAIFEGYAVQRFGFRAKCSFLLKSLKLTLEQMLHGLDHCDYEICTHAAIYRTDLEAQEQHIDEFLRLLKSGLLDEHTPCEALERVLHYMNGLLKNLLTPQALIELLDEQQLYNTLLEVYEAGLDCVNTNAGMLHTIIQLGDEQTESFQCMQFLMETSCAYKQKLKKLQRRLTGDNNAAWTGMQCVRYQHIQDTNEALGSLIKLLAMTAKEATKDNAPIAHDKLWRLLAVNYSKYVNTNTNVNTIEQQQQQTSQQHAGVFGQHCMQLLDNQMEQLSDLLESQENVRSANVHTVCVRHATTNTLLQRAAQVRQHYEDVKALEQAVGEREKEIKSLKYVAKMKQQDFSELQIRKEMAEKQLTKLTNEQVQLLSQLATGVEQLEQTLLTKEATFINVLNSFNDKLRNLESAQSCWQQQLVSANACANTTTVASNLELQLLHSSLRAQRTERAALQVMTLKSRFRSLEPIYVPQRHGQQQSIKQLERDLYDLKRAWILSHISLVDNGASDRPPMKDRRAIEARSSEVLRNICQTYCDMNPHRAAHTHFGFFVSDELRHALL